MLWLFLAPLLLVAQMAFGESRGEALAQVKSLIDKNHTRLIELDSSISKALMGIRDLGLTQNQETRTKLVGLEKELEKLSFQRQEHLLRQEFLDRLSFQVDRHFQRGDLKAFLEKKTLEMAQTEISSPQSDSNMWKFLSYLSLAIKELPERHENPFAFIEGYMRFSTLLNPLRPDEYLAQRNYTNGHDFETAAPMEADRVGEVVDAKIQEAQSHSQKDRLPFEERKPFLKPMSQVFQEPKMALEPQTLQTAPTEKLERPHLLKERVVETLKSEVSNSAPAEVKPAAPVPVPTEAAPQPTPLKKPVKKAIPLPPPYNNATVSDAEMTSEAEMNNSMKVELVPALERAKQTN